MNRAPTLAETLHAAAQASLRSPLNPHRDLEAAELLTPEAVAAAMAHRPEPPEHERATGKSALAIKRAHARRLRDAGDATTPAEVPRVKPARVFHPSKPYSSRRDRRFAAAIARSNNPRFAPRDWCDRTWSGVRTAFHDTGGARARALLDELPRPLALRARFGILSEQHARGDLAPGIDWTHITARGMVCCAVVLYRESVATSKRGFARVLVGVSQKMFASLFRNHAGDRTHAAPHYHRNSLFATEVRGDKNRGGWVVALARAGFVTMIQPPAEACPRELVGPSGYALGQFWITERASVEPPSVPILEALDRADALEAPSPSPRALAPPE